MNPLVMIRARDNNNRIALVSPESVTMMRWADRELILFLDDGSIFFSPYVPITRVLDAFPGVWERTTRSVAVKRTMIASARRGEVKLTNGERVPISRRKYEALITTAFGHRKRDGDE